MTDKELTQWMADGRIDTFAPGFSGRVRQRLERQAAAAQWTVLLLVRFRRLAAVALFVALGLVIYNLRDLPGRDAAQTPVEAVLAVPPLTLDAAYTLDLPTDAP